MSFYRGQNKVPSDDVTARAYGSDVPFHLGAKQSLLSDVTGHFLRKHPVSSVAART